MQEASVTQQLRGAAQSLDPHGQPVLDGASVRRKLL